MLNNTMNRGKLCHESLTKTEVVSKLRSCTRMDLAWRVISCYFTAGQHKRNPRRAWPRWATATLSGKTHGTRSIAVSSPFSAKLYCSCYSYTTFKSRYLVALIRLQGAQIPNYTYYRWKFHILSQLHNCLSFM